jgi:hypothetical protein
VSDLINKDVKHSIAEGKLIWVCLFYPLPAPAFSVASFMPTYSPHSLLISNTHLKPQQKRRHIMKTSVSILILSVILSVALVTPSYADQLKPGMANTVTLADESVVYDLNGEWDAVYDNKQFGISKDIVKITQEGNKFVAIKLIGNAWVGKGKETLKGELGGDGFKSIYGNSQASGWQPSTGKILDGGNKIVEEQFIERFDYTCVITLTRK